MLRLALSARDVSHVRLAFSPLWEVVASLRVLHSPASHAVHLPWVKQVSPAIEASSVDMGTLTALTLAHPRRIPGFLAPTPTTPTPDLRTELDALRSTGVTDLDEDPFATSNAPIVRQLRSDPAAALERIRRSVEGYWSLALEPYWPRMRRLLEGDILYQARQFADGGAERLLNGLDPSIRWRDDLLSVAHSTVADERRLDGRGLVLVPSVFVWPLVASKTDEPWQPTLRFPVRGVGTLWERGAATPEALAAVIGRSRARMLAELAVPMSTTDLARHMGMSPGGISQHLTALRDAGLVTATRIGRSVLYARTTLGDDLLPSA